MFESIDDIDYICNIKLLDNEHADFFSSLKKLKVAIENNDTKENILNLINKVDISTTKHFEHEEEVAEKCNFSRTKDLKESHNDFRETCKVIKRVYGPEKENICKLYGIHVLDLLYNWVITHFDYVETELIQHLRKCKKEGILDIE